MYRLKHCRECYTVKNKARGNEAEMANIARGEAECYISIEAECFIFHIARARQCFNCYREFPLQIRAPL